MTITAKTSSDAASQAVWLQPPLAHGLIVPFWEVSDECRTDFARRRPAARPRFLGLEDAAQRRRTGRFQRTGFRAARSWEPASPAGFARAQRPRLPRRAGR